jgi:BON domain
MDDERGLEAGMSDKTRDRIGLLLLGTAIGVALGRLTVKRTRTTIRDRSAATMRRTGRRTVRLGRHAGSRAHGLTQRAIHVREKRKDFDDVTLADKIRSEIFRPADVPKGQINVNVQNGVVQLRGEVPRPELIDDLVAQVRRIQGVEDVENLLHVPGVTPQMHQ